MNTRAFAFFLASLLALVATSAHAKQVAVVVGNNAYTEIPQLSAGVSDARAMADGLKRVGFSVELVENGTKRQISRVLAKVENEIQPGDTVLFHYSGHGFEIDGQNWLLPVDVPAAKQGEAGLVKDASFNASDIIDRLRSRGAGTVVAILDACRNNPFARTGTRALSGSRGLAGMEASGGVFIMFSAGQKQEALDKLADNDPIPTSVFVRSLLPLMERSDLSLIDIAKETQHQVRSLAHSVGHEQVPAYYDGIVGRVSLSGAPITPSTTHISPAPANPFAASPVAEETFWRSIEQSNHPAMFQAYLSQVDKKVFSGTYASAARDKLRSLEGKTDNAPSPSPQLTNQQAAPATAPTSPKQETAPSSEPTRSPDAVACDRLAAAPEDPDRPGDVPGVSLTRYGADAAISACQRAANAAGAPRRMMYQLARAQDVGQSALALSTMQRAADLGHPLALAAMADRYRTGRGIPKDAGHALSLYFKAGDAGLNAAIVRIGSMYARGEGAERDYTKAVAFYNLALKVSEPTVYAELGLLYLRGNGVKRDRQKACDLFRQGAERGNESAARNVSAYCGR